MKQWVSQHKQRGISLVETVVTLAILSFGLVALMKLQAYLVGHSANSKEQTEATTLAQKKIEELRDYQQINTSSGVKSYDDITSGSQTVNGVASTYTLSWAVTSNNVPDHKTIDLTVTWTDRSNVNHTINLSSIIAKTDPASSGVIIGSSGAGAIQP